MGRAWNQTNAAAGSSSTSVFVPPISANRPSTISTAVHAIGFIKFAFFEFAVITKLLIFLLRAISFDLAVKLVLIALKADACYAEADHGEGE